MREMERFNSNQDCGDDAIIDRVCDRCEEATCPYGEEGYLICPKIKKALESFDKR